MKPRIEILLAAILFSGTALSGQWQLGLGVENQQPVLLDKYREAEFAPVIVYIGERFSATNGTLSYTLSASDTAQWSLLGQGRSSIHEDGRGDGPASMDERDAAFDLGLAFTASGSWGVARLELLGDVSNTYDGNEITASYRHPLQSGRWLFEPAIGVNWQSEALTDYYYGVKADEARPGRATYRGEAASNPFVEAVLAYRIDRNWLAVGGIEYRRLGAGIADSPIVERDDRVTGFTAVLYQF